MRLFRSRSLLLVPLLLALGCPPAGPAPLTDADRAAIGAVSDSFATRIVAGDEDGVTALYTENGAVMAPDAPAVRGRAAIKAFVGAFPRAASFTLANDTIVGMGDRAYVRGRFTIGFADSTLPPMSGKFIEIRHKQPDGRWLLEVDMWSSDAPAPAPAPVRPRR